MKMNRYLILLFCLASLGLQAQNKELPQFSTKIALDSLQQAMLHPLKGKPVNMALSKDLPTVLFFLSPECPLCHNYTRSINELRNEFGSRVNLVGIIPGKSYSNREIKKYQKDYSVSIPLYSDRSFQLTRLLGISVTPEVVLMDGSGEIFYRGAIDDWIISLGKKKEKPGKFYLKNAIMQKLENSPILTASTKAIGCYINDY